jgi:hypothetical protein
MSTPFNEQHSDRYGGAPHLREHGGAYLDESGEALLQPAAVASEPVGWSVESLAKHPRWIDRDM